jgi:hypothetical protein
MNITFDSTINLGNALTFFGFVIMATAMVYTLRANVRSLADRMREVEFELRKLTEVMVTLGRQDERLNAQTQRMLMIEQRIDELAHGQGFVEVEIPRRPRERA